MSTLFSKPWSAAQFITNRPYLTTWVNNSIIPHLDAPDCRRLLINAPVKSGKREIAEYTSMLDHSSNSEHIKHIFISAWHRAADEEQRIELSQHYLQVFSIINKKERDRCLQFINEQLRNNKQLRIHYDECDHGSGSRQLMSQLWRVIRDNENIKTIMYSATHEEVLFSAEINDDDGSDYEEMINEYRDAGVVVTYEPPPGFCGPKEFLDANLVMNATRFIEKTPTGTFTLSSQAKDIISDLKNSMSNPETRKKNIIILRLSSSEKTKNTSSRMDKKDIYQFLKHIHLMPELEHFITIVDKSEINSPELRNNPRIIINTIGWSKPEYWRSLSTEYPTIVVIDQTASRSTELACHDRLFAYHDFRNIFTYSVLAQAQQRPNHYTSKYEGGFQRIRIYGHKPTFELSAGVISYQQYINLEYSKKKVTNDNKFRIIHSINRTPHPEFSNEYSEQRTEEILAIIGCLATPLLSARLKGGIRDIIITDSQFIPCDSETFEEIALPQINLVCPNQTFQNPFTRAAEHRDESGKFMGYLREWKVLDYETEIKQSRWGFSLRHLNCPLEQRSGRITICYDNNILGVAIRKPVGKESVDSLTTTKSQYRS